MFLFEYTIAPIDECKSAHTDAFEQPDAPATFLIDGSPRFFGSLAGWPTERQ
jgi:hypothetical protein